ncbi:MAG: hypothetical protein GX066_03910 [Clostridiaceae bacterium]|nr:hypothetical protein [Clostridiaceae bacterium]
MIDLHAHILPGIDDGAGDEEAALSMLQMAAKDGTKHIVATPHYIHGIINNNKPVVCEKVRLLNEKLQKSDIDIQIYPGSEVFICPEIPRLLDMDEICTLNHSSYILIELPMMSIPPYTKEIIYQVRLRGKVPIIAHTERNQQIANDPNKLYELIEMGALSQVNASSIKGIFGKKVREAAYTLLRHNMVHFISSDAHNCRGRSPKMGKIREVIQSEFGSRTAACLFKQNAWAVLNDKPLDIPDPERVVNKHNYIIPFFASWIAKFQGKA